MTVRGSWAMRCATSGATVSAAAAACGAAVVVVIVDVWQAAAAPARTMRSRFMTLSFGTRDCMRAERLLSSRHFAGEAAVDHRVHELSRAVPVRRRTLRAEAVQEDQMRQVQRRLRNSQSRICCEARNIRWRYDVRSPRRRADACARAGGNDRAIAAARA